MGASISRVCDVEPFGVGGIATGDGSLSGAGKKGRKGGADYGDGAQVLTCVCTSHVPATLILMYVGCDVL